MRIAVCLSGQPRFLKECFPKLVQNLIIPNNADVFYHTWWDENVVNTAFDSSQVRQDGKVGSFTSDIPDLLEKLDAKSFIIEPPKNFQETDSFNTSPNAKQSSLCSAFYSQWQCGKLKAQYEADHSFKYDIVVRARFDLYYSKIIKLDELTILEDNIILESTKQDKRQTFIPGLGDYTMDDTFAVSNSDNMDKYFSLYTRMKEINDIINPPYGENYTGWNCKKIHGLKVSTENFGVEIAQRLMDNWSGIPKTIR
jgi:hypothetical protein